MSINRLEHVIEFYSILDDLKNRLGGYRRLADCNGRMKWPGRGVYFFFDEDEPRVHSGQGPRVVRVGTHAISKGSSSTLWKRLSTHKGSKTGGGNHRGSVFRKLIGASLLKKADDISCATWGGGRPTTKGGCQSEHRVECIVSSYIGQLPILWIDIDDEPSPQSVRSYIERNSIALLSNYAKSPSTGIDPPSQNWLGKYCINKHIPNCENIQKSGLWNSNHVTEQYDPSFLETFRKLMELV